MSHRKFKSIIRTAVITFIAVIAACSLVITFASGKNIPSWQQIYSYFGINNKAGITDDYVRFLDVGQGDSILIHSNGRSALIDSSTLSFGDNICDKLRVSGIKSLDLMLLSHNHDDHYGGAERITERFMVDKLIMPDISGSTNSTSTITEIRNNVLADDGESYTAVQGMNVNIGDFTLTVLAHYTDQEDENNRSIFAMAEMNGVKFLFTGDAEAPVEKLILNEGLNLDCDVLKVGHHGAKTSSSKEFLVGCDPEYAVISCGAGNQYSHPHEAALSRLDEVDAEIYRTDLQGDITFYVDGGKLLVETEK